MATDVGNDTSVAVGECDSIGKDVVPARRGLTGRYRKGLAVVGFPDDNIRAVCVLEARSVEEWALWYNSTPFSEEVSP